MQSLNGNYIDLVIIVVLLFFIYEGFRHGVWVMTADFLAFLGSLIVAIGSYRYLGTFLKSNFSLSSSVSSALGFLVTAIVVEFVLGHLLGILVSKIPDKLTKGLWVKVTSIIPSLGEVVVIVSFILVLIIGLPINPAVKADIANSRIGGRMVSHTQGLEARINEIFGGVIEESITYITIEPESKKTIELTTNVGELKNDEKAEASLFQKLNEERQKVGVGALTWKPELVPIARQHAKDMWERKYFGHISPDGEDVGDRLKEAKIGYIVAGENLALAPTVSIAHTGLMNSEGHRANILDPEYDRVGVGVVDNGIYGKMFVQIFIK